VLGNDAGNGSYGAINYFPMDVGRRQFELNVFGAYRIAQRVLP
jgi:short-subunit dehydrogenase